MYNIIIIIIFVIAIIYIHDNFILPNNCLHYYNNIDNDNDLNNAKSYLNREYLHYNRTPLDNYRIGSIHDFVLHDTDTATNYYKQAIKQIRNEPTINSVDTRYIRDNIFVRDRLLDRIRINDDIEQDDNKYNLHQLNDLNNEVMRLEQQLEQQLFVATPIVKSDDSKFTKLVNNNIIKSDSQNVHDSNINEEIKNQFQKIKDFNNINGVYIWNYNDIIDYIKNVYSNRDDLHAKDKAHIPNAISMLNYINKYESYIMKLNINEKDFIRHVFSKIQYGEDIKIKNTQMENLVLNLKESYSTGVPVCVTGRVTRIMSSFANIDSDIPELGELRSKQVIKNEILFKTGALRTKIMDLENPDNIDKYNKSIQDEDTIKLENKLKKEISDMILDEYSKIYIEDKKFIDNIIKEIHAEI